MAELHKYLDPRTLSKISKLEVKARMIVEGYMSGSCDGRYYVNTDDIASVAKPVLRHRILTNYAADAEGITSDAIIEKLLAQVQPNESELSKKVENF